MGSTFNPQILVDKLAKLNNSQASIETLSHWCIFHMNKAKHVVETWDRQFHCSPREQRLAFLYLANDILQNSRRKGSEFVAEFWKVLPDAFRDMIQNGDEVGKNAALRLIGILEERKVFGSRGQTLKEEILGKHLENNNRIGKQIGAKLQKQPVGSMMDKIVSGYQVVYAGQMDEDSILNKCRSSISYIEKIDKEIGGQLNSEQLHGTALEELQAQHSSLKDCIKQLMAIESSRSSLLSYLREAVREEETKLEQIRQQLQAAQVQSEHAGNICQQLPQLGNAQIVVEQSSKESTPITSQGYAPGEREQSASVMYERQASFSDQTNRVDDPRKSAAAAVAAKLTASTSSAEMLSYVLSSLASEGLIGSQIKESSSADYPSSEKRARLETDQPYVPAQNPSQPQHPFQHNATTMSQQLTPNDPPPLPSSPPPMAPLPPMPVYSMPQYMPSNAGINSAPYCYNMSQQQLTNSMPVYPAVGTQMTGVAPFAMAQTNSYQSYQGSEGNLYNPQPSVPMAPISRQ